MDPSIAQFLVYKEDEGNYYGLFHAAAACRAHILYCVGKARLSDGSYYKERVVRLQGKQVPEHVAFAEIEMEIIRSLAIIAGLDASTARLTDYPDSDSYYSSLRFSLLPGLEPRDEPGFSVLLHLCYVKASGCNPFSEKHIDNAIEMLYEISPYDQQETYHRIAQKWQSDDAVPNPPSAKSKAPKASSSEGCYIATAVYGSYDCPEVWTLRRFRDYQLRTTWCGRAFVCLYYRISPKLVRTFGDKKLFGSIFRIPLNLFVRWLQACGTESGPYRDK